jgi:hypothetical protein
MPGRKQSRNDGQRTQKTANAPATAHRVPKSTGTAAQAGQARARTTRGAMASGQEPGSLVAIRCPAGSTIMHKVPCGPDTVTQFSAATCANGQSRPPSIASPCHGECRDRQPFPARLSQVPANIAQRNSTMFARSQGLHPGVAPLRPPGDQCPG